MRRTPLSREWAERGLAPGWQAINGNKRSLTLDLSKPEAINIVKQLAAQADVVMENFRPGVMDKLGIGYAALSGDQSAADLLRHFRFWPDRPGTIGRRL
jgi:Predicted acyl-CoA transferases/carnitine dehydratase